MPARSAKMHGKPTDKKTCIFDELANYKKWVPGPGVYIKPLPWCKNERDYRGRIFPGTNINCFEEDIKSNKEKHAPGKYDNRHWFKYSTKLQFGFSYQDG